MPQIKRRQNDQSAPLTPEPPHLSLVPQPNRASVKRLTRAPRTPVIPASAANQAREKQRTTISNVERALVIAKRWPVLPVKLSRDPRPDDPGHLAKVPAILDWWNQACQDDKTIRRWWRQFPDAVVAIPTGTKTGVIVVDVDDPAALEEFELDLGDGVRVPSHRPGGSHYYFALPLSKDPPPGSADGRIDCRSEGNCVVVWGDPPEKSRLNPLPEEVAEFFRRRAGRRSNAGGEAPEFIYEGSRNTTLTSLGGTMRRGGMSEEAISAALLAENDTRCRPPLEAVEVEKIASSVSRYDPHREQLPLSDRGNAERLVAKFGYKIRYVPELGHEGKGGWHIWNGSRWARDTDGFIIELCKETARSISEEWVAMTEQGGDATATKQSYQRWARASESATRLRATRYLACSDRAVVLRVDELNTNKKLVNCPNGTVDLTAHKLRAGDPLDYITKSTGFAYRPDAPCAKWTQFIRWLVLGRPELEEYLQRCLGYSLEGGNPERLVFLVYGIGRNGKSTLLKVLRRILGDYAMWLDKKAFLASGDGRSASPYLAQLPGYRLTFTSETEDDGRLAVGLVKAMTGDEPIQARALYKDPFEFVPEFTPWIASNTKPDVPADDQAFWDRLRVIPCEARVSDEDTNERLGDELLGEAEGILGWLVEGHRKYSEELGPDKFCTPQVVLDANAEYREEMDEFAPFISHLKHEEQEGQEINWRRTPLLDRYREWAQAHSAPSLTARKFKAQMEAKGYKVRGELHEWRRDGWTESDDAELAVTLGRRRS